MRNSSLDHEPLSLGESDNVHKKGENNANVIPILRDENRAELLVNGPFFWMYSLAF